MSKIGLIIKREYTSRVFKKSFLLVTILTPLLIGAVMVLVGYLSVNAGDSNKNILIKDDSNIINRDSFNDSEIKFTFSDETLEKAKKQYSDNDYDLLVHVPPLNDTSTTHQLNYYSKEKLSIIQINNIENKFEDVLREYRIQKSNIGKDQLARLNVKAKMENALLKETDESIKGDKSSKFSTSIASGLSYFMGFLMYMVIFIFGSMVMRSVMEEKVNRIVEVMISSVKPFDLMLGKVIGVGLVGLTQLLVWIVLTIIMALILPGLFSPEAAAELNPSANQAMETVKQIQAEENGIKQFLKELTSLNWALIIPVFVFFFFGGYFIYSTLFAAAGSATGDDLNDSQQLILPLTIPVIIGFAMIGPVIVNPNGGLAIFGSMFPLLSPILMPARLPFDPPLWQIILSIVLLILGILFFTWMAGRIYRIGILMYGKKVSFKEIGKWIFYKD